MRKEDLLKFGVPEQNVQALREAIFAESNSHKEKQIRKEKEAQAALVNADLRKAIFAMVTVITETEYLKRILSFCNNQFYIQEKGDGIIVKVENQQSKSVGIDNGINFVETDSERLQNEADI